MIADLLRFGRVIRRPVPENRAGFVANWFFLWLIIIFLAIIDLVFLRNVGIHLKNDGIFDLNPLVSIVIIPVAFFYSLMRFDEKFSSVLNAFAAIMIASPVLCLFTYIAAAIGHGTPLRDGALAHFDESIGVHWPAMVLWADNHPVLASLGSFAYGSLSLQGALMVLVLTAWGQAERLQIAVYAFIIGAFCCAVVSALIPAIGAYTYYGIEPSQFTHIDLATRDGHVADVLALRSGSMTYFSFAAAKGIITFPSFHATLGILFSWSMWGVKWLRWPISALNVVLIAATPLQGSHYVADLLAGALVAWVAIASAAALHEKVGFLASRAAPRVAIEPSRIY